MTPKPLLYVGDLAVGTIYPLPRHEVSEREIVHFARLWDPQYFHLEPQQTRHPRFTGVIASGIHTIAVLHRLTIEAVYTNWVVVAGRGMEAMRFLGPVTPGTVLTGTATITAIRRNRDDMGLVTLASELTDVDGSPLLRGSVETYVAERS